jgi:hypothetical protein
LWIIECIIVYGVFKRLCIIKSGESRKYVVRVVEKGSNITK